MGYTTRDERKFKAHASKAKKKKHLSSSEPILGLKIRKVWASYKRKPRAMVQMFSSIEETLTDLKNEKKEKDEGTRRKAYR
jgi:hypothetical protein